MVKIDNMFTFFHKFVDFVNGMPAGCCLQQLQKYKYCKSVGTAVCEIQDNKSRFSLD